MNLFIFYWYHYESHSRWILGSFSLFCFNIVLFFFFVLSRSCACLRCEVEWPTQGCQAFETTISADFFWFLPIGEVLQLLGFAVS